MTSIIIHLKQNGETSSLLTINNHKIIIDRPVSKGGYDEGPMGGQVLLMSVAGCFSSTLHAAAQARNLSIRGLEMHVIGKLSNDEPRRFTAVQLEVINGNCDDPEQLNKLLKIAEKGCIAVNTIKHGMAFAISDSRNIDN